LIDVDQKIEQTFHQTVLKVLNDIKRSITDETAPLFQAQTELAPNGCAIKPSFEKISDTLVDLREKAIALCSEFGPLYWLLKDKIVVKRDEDYGYSDEVQEEEFSGEKRHFHSFFDQVCNDPEIKGLIDDINKAIAGLDGPLRAHLDGWHKFHEL